MNPAVELDVALIALVQVSLPHLFGQASPTVALSVASDALLLVPRESEPAASDPRPGDQVDELPFVPATPHGPYTLSRPPYPGPRRVRLVAPGATVPLTDAEVQWDAVNPQVMTLNPRASRDLGAVTTVEVLYGVTSVFHSVAARRTLVLAMSVAAADVAKLAGAVALALGVIELNRAAFTGAVAVSYADGDYGVLTRVRSLRLTGVTAPVVTRRLLTLEADVTLTLNRALRQFEGTPIQQISSPGLVPAPKRPVQIDIGVGA